MKALFVICMLSISNVFMTIAWYGQLRLKDFSWFASLPLAAIILISWAVALFEYSFMIPANKIGFVGNGGPFNMWQLKIIQEFISIVVFTIFTILVFKNETLRLNHVIGFTFLMLAVYFIFKR